MFFLFRALRVRRRQRALTPPCGLQPAQFAPARRVAAGRRLGPRVRRRQHCRQQRAPEPPRQPRRQRPSQPHRRRAARPRWLACAPRWAALPHACALLSPPPPARPPRLLACLAPCAWAPPPVWPLLPAPVPGRVLPPLLRAALACLAPAPSPGGCAFVFPGRRCAACG